MATIYEYHSIDFNHTLKLDGSIPKNDNITFEIFGHLLYDFISYNTFVSFYFREKNLDYNFFESFLNYYNKNLHAKWIFDGKITLPNSHLVRGLEVKIKRESSLEISVAFPGEEPMETSQMGWNGRMYIYSESNLNKDEISKLNNVGKNLNYHIQFRSKEYERMRNMKEKPLAFISHDSRDKDEVARYIASKLTSMGCPVWYDEYSLKVGDNLRESIEHGIKECKHCILILSKNFISNQGWTKTEFDAVFTKQIIKESNIVLPVWLDVDKEDVYEYSPSLLNTMGLNWSSDKDKICNQLFSKIMSEEKQ